MSKSDRLTEKQRRFVEAFMGEAVGNATLAAKLAGYKGSQATLGVAGAQNLNKAMIQKAIAERADDDPAVASRKERQQFWTRVMRGEENNGPSKYFDLEGKNIPVPVEMRDRLKAAELLGKTQADFIERVEHSGKDGGPIATQLGLSDESADLLRRKVLGVGE